MGNFVLPYKYSIPLEDNEYGKGPLSCISFKDVPFKWIRSSKLVNHYWNKLLSGPHESLCLTSQDITLTIRNTRLSHEKFTHPERDVQVRERLSFIVDRCASHNVINLTTPTTLTMRRGRRICLLQANLSEVRQPSSFTVTRLLKNLNPLHYSTLLKYIVQLLRHQFKQSHLLETTCLIATSYSKALHLLSSLTEISVLFSPILSLFSRFLTFLLSLLSIVASWVSSTSSSSKSTTQFVSDYGCVSCLVI